MKTSSSSTAAPSSDALALLQAELPHIPKAERSIASTILKEPESVLNLGIVELAAKSNTSTTSVTRMCNRLGFKGFKGLRVNLASAVSRERTQLEGMKLESPDINPDDTPQMVVGKVALLEINAIRDTTSNIDLGELRKAAQLLSASERIDIFGYASSNLSAQDFQQKLQRIGKIAFSWSDHHLALTAAALECPGKIAVGISSSGRTKETVECLRVSREHGALTIALTSSHYSPINEEADIVLITHARESTFRAGATAARIAQLAYIDVLFTLVAQGSSVASSKTLRDTRQTVETHKIKP